MVVVAPVSSICWRPTSIRDEPTGGAPWMWVPVTTTSETAEPVAPACASAPASCDAPVVWAPAAPATSAQVATPASRRPTHGDTPRTLFPIGMCPSLYRACATPLWRSCRFPCAEGEIAPVYGRVNI